jgi:hypothetical protein
MVYRKRGKRGKIIWRMNRTDKGHLPMIAVDFIRDFLSLGKIFTVDNANTISWNSSAGVKDSWKCRLESISG